MGMIIGNKYFAKVPFSSVGVIYSFDILIFEFTNHSYKMYLIQEKVQYTGHCQFNEHLTNIRIRTQCAEDV